MFESSLIFVVLKNVGHPSFNLIFFNSALDIVIS